MLSALTVKAPIFEIVSNVYDCITGVCDPNLLMVPGSARPYTELSDNGVTTMPARDIRWTQDTVTRRTGDGIYLDDLAEDMFLNGWKGDPLRVVRDGDLFWSIDNRRLAAAQLADIDVPVTLFDSPLDLPSDLFKKFVDHNTTTTMGQMVEVVECRNCPKLGIRIKIGGEIELYDP